MPYVEPLSKASAPEGSQKLLGAIEDKYGQILNIFGTLAYHPDILKGVAAINDGLESGLPGTLRELAYYRSSQINQCDYCSHYHQKAALRAGLSEAQLAAADNSKDSDLFSEAEKHVLAYAEQLTRTGNVEDATAKSVQSHLSESEMVALAATVALANFTNRFNHGLGIELP